MSLAIDVDKVKKVLLPGGWVEVADASFTLDSYEFTWNGELVHGGGNSGVCATGFQFKSQKGGVISGPLTTIQAVRTD